MIITIIIAIMTIVITVYSKLQLQWRYLQSFFCCPDAFLHIPECTLAKKVSQDYIFLLNEAFQSLLDVVSCYDNWVVSGRWTSRIER